MHLLGVDIGTTHCKAGVFDQDGTLLASAREVMQVHRAGSGYAYYEPEELWRAAVAVMRRALAGQAGPVSAVGIASMAETGLLVDRRTGAPRSRMIPWFDKRAAPQAARLAAAGGPKILEERFYLSGIRPTFKCSLAKILWLHEQDPAVTAGSAWLSAADYVAYRLTGVMASDYSLAGRTYAFRIDRRIWDEDWLNRFGLQSENFPTLLPSGIPAGPVAWGGLSGVGLLKGTPVAVAGHDHVCAAFAVGAFSGAIRPGQVLDSMGTAESLLGAYANDDLGEKEFESGLSYGCHVARGKQYWMGGLSASGGSVEWLRALIGDWELSYRQVEALVKSAARPTGILYFPYLSGSGSPHTDPEARAAFLGLDSAHGRAELLAAVLEGTAYEMEYTRRRAGQVTGLALDSISVVGGGAQNRAWLQIKADVSGIPLSAPKIPEAALLGAALVAGIGCRVYASQRAAFSSLASPEAETFLPDERRHAAYRRLYERGFLAFQEPLRAYFRSGGS